MFKCHAYLAYEAMFVVARSTEPLATLWMHDTLSVVDRDVQASVQRTPSAVRYQVHDPTCRSFPFPNRCRGFLLIARFLAPDDRDRGDSSAVVMDVCHGMLV